MTVQNRIKETIDNNRIVLFMKGSPHFPQCGFSGRTVQILQACDAEFAAVDVLADMEIRDGIKQFSSWPTVPQLYIDGDFIGGSDIVMELYQSGELQQKLASRPAA